MPITVLVNSPSTNVRPSASRPMQDQKDPALPAPPEYTDLDVITDLVP